MGLAAVELLIGTIKQGGSRGQRISGRHAAGPTQEKINLYDAIAAVAWMLLAHLVWIEMWPREFVRQLWEPVACHPGCFLDPFKIENGTGIDLTSIDRRKKCRGNMSQSCSRGDCLLIFARTAFLMWSCAPKIASLKDRRPF